MGLKKIEMKKISSHNALKTSFTKRRQGLFRKADQFCTRTGAQIVIIAFSPGDNPFTFGHPSVDSVINCYYYSGKQVPEENDDLGSVIDEDENVKFWLDKPIEVMRLKELKELACCVEDELEEMKMRDACTKDLLGLNWKGDDPKLDDEMKMRESCTKDFLANWA